MLIEFTKKKIILKREWNVSTSICDDDVNWIPFHLFPVEITEKLPKLPTAKQTIKFESSDHILIILVKSNLDSNYLSHSV